ncbi:MAG: hypothetical protein IKH21_09705, partial [Clostridia bacterium]|nr:hypothetical protein [Clostridia bacterium]
MLGLSKIRAYRGAALPSQQSCFGVPLKSQHRCDFQTADKPQMRRKYLPSPVRGRGTAASAVVDEVAKKLNKHLAFLIVPLFPPHQ